MTDPSTLPDLTGLEPDAWFARLDAIGEEHGHFQQMGPRHANLFIDAGRQLLVTFETVESARRQPRAIPRGAALAHARGWSHLMMLGDGQTWFRDPAVWGTFDRLTDDGFFEDFEQVLFVGADSCGHAAAALSVAAPGARVLLIRPQATLTPRLAGWDRRFPETRRMDFTSRYGYAPDMIDAAARVDIIYNPRAATDSIHAAMFARDNVVLHQAIGAGGQPEAAFDQLGVTEALIAAAMAGELTSARFGAIWRARRNYAPYLRHLLKRLETENRPGLAARLCHHGLGTREAALFAARLRELQAATAAE